MSDLSASEMLAAVATEAPSVNSEPSSAPAPTQSTNWWDPHLKSDFEYEIEGGKKIKEPLEMVRKRAALGYNYAQRAHLLNQKEENYKQIEERNKQLGRWQEYDDYASKNPDWAKHVEESWNNKSGLVQSSQGQIAQLPPEVAQEIESLKKFKQQMEEREQKAQFESEDKQMAEEINTIAKQFGEKFSVDLSQADEKGQTLEWRILEHMKALGFDGSKKGQFAAAFKDMYLDTLLERQKERAKEEYAKNQAELKKAGIREISRTPKQAEDFNGYRKGASQTELRDAAVAELMRMQGSK